MLCAASLVLGLLSFLLLEVFPGCSLADLMHLGLCETLDSF